MKKDLAVRACQLEIKAAQASLESALNDVEMAIKAIRAQLNRNHVLPSDGRRLMADSAEVLQYMTTIATLATCRPLIGRDDQD